MQQYVNESTNSTVIDTDDKKSSEVTTRRNSNFESCDYCVLFYQIYFNAPLGRAAMWLNRVLPALLIPLGTLASLTVILIMAKCNCGLTRYIRFSYITMATLDLLMVLNHNFFQYLAFLLKDTDHSLPLPYNNLAFCIVTIWLFHCSLSTSATLSSIFALERTSSICNPLRSRVSVFNRHILKITVAWIAFCFLFNVTFMFHTSIRPIQLRPYSVCSTTHAGFFLEINVVYDILFAVLPFFVEFAVNLRLGLKLRQVSRVRALIVVQGLRKNSATAMVVLFTNISRGIFMATIGTAWLVKNFYYILTEYPLRSITVLANFMFIAFLLLPLFLSLASFAVYFKKITKFRTIILNFFRRLLRLQPLL